MSKPPKIQEFRDKNKNVKCQVFPISGFTKNVKTWVKGTPFGENISPVKDFHKRKSIFHIGHLPEMKKKGVYLIVYKTGKLRVELFALSDGNNVVTLVWGDNPVAFLIHSKQVADKYRLYFEECWKSSKK